jgi:hypothetical protein
MDFEIFNLKGSQLPPQLTLIASLVGVSGEQTGLSEQE